MKFFRIYIFPALYGLLVYFTIRLLHDTDIGSKFWQRPLPLTIIEMLVSIITGYLAIMLLKRLIVIYDKRWADQFNYRSIARELAILVICNLMLVNLLITPMAALTDDGLSWADVASINTIPILYAVIYYGITRSRTYLKAYVNNRLLLEKISNEHLQTELKFLKAQYHPHFLFNALNTIYFQMDEDMPGAKRSIEKFSELLRYQLYDQQQQVAVIKEVEYLQSFIELQKIRSSDKLKLSVCFDKQLNGQMVYPLLFLPLVENAFKFIGGHYQMMVDARVVGNNIDFRVENSVPSIKPSQTKEGGIGLENLKRRLSLLYPGKHSFETWSGESSFIAELKVVYHEQ